MSRRRFGKRLGAGLLAALIPLCGAGTALASDADIERTETVYVTADAEGRTESVLSSVYLVNPDGRATIADSSSLTGIKNILANEAPEKENGAWVFQTGGDDVSYQGTADTKALPVKMSVRYELDGVPMTPQQIAGKSGRVRVTVAYENRVRSAVDVNGESVELYTPFSVITIITLDDGFQRVAVENAKLMKEAGSTTIVGTTFPGLAANLDTEAEDTLSESFSFEANVKSFALEPIMAVVVPDLLNADDLKSTDDLRDFVDGVGELNDAGDKLTRGARSLSGGANKFAAALESYLSGIGTLKSVADGLNAGIGAADVSGLASALEQAGGKTALAGGKVGDAANSVATARAKLAGLEGLTAEQQAIVGSASSDLSNAFAALGEAGTAISDAGSALAGASMPDLSGLKQGVAGLAGGLAELESNAGGIQDGADGLRKGAGRLHRGIRTFCNDGLKELEKQTEGLAVSVDRKEAMLELGAAYTAYSADDVMNGSVKFVITTDSIYVPKTEAPAVTETPAPQENVEGDEATPPQSGKNVVRSVFDRLGEWFTQLFDTVMGR